MFSFEHFVDLPLDLVRPDHCGDFSLRSAGRLRSGSGRALSVCTLRPMPGSHDEFHRPILGRQRNLAGAGGRRVVCSFSAGLCDPDAGALHPGHHHAAGSDFQGRGLRVPFQGVRPNPGRLGLRIPLRFAGGGLHAGHDHRGHRAGGGGRRPAVCRRRLRLAQCLQRDDRLGPGLRLCAAGSHLAGHENRGITQEWARKCAAYVLGYVGLFLAIVSISMPVMNPGIRALWWSLPNFFYPAAHPLCQPGFHHPDLAGSSHRAGGSPVPAEPRCVSDGLHGVGHQPVAVCGSFCDHLPPGCRGTRIPIAAAGRHGYPAAAGARLHRLLLLPVQG